MPTQRDARLSHATRFVEVLVEVNDLGDVSEQVRGSKLNELEDVWLQIERARDWASENAEVDLQAKQIVEAFENAGVEVAQIRAETRTALRQLSGSLLKTKDDATR